MTYSIMPTEPLSEAVYRILGEQSADAVAALNGEDKAKGVHEARKAAKRCRALLHAVRPGFTHDAWVMERDRFRDAARAIGARRDADVRLATFDALARGEYPEIRVALEAGRDTLDPTAIATAITGFVATPVVPITLEADALMDGITATYRQMRAAAEHGGEKEGVHDFRRRVKAHYFQLQLVRAAWPPVLGAMVKDADRLQEELGLWHDHAVLQGWLTETGLRNDTLDARLAAAMGDHMNRTAAWAPKLTAMKSTAFRDWLWRLWR